MLSLASNAWAIDEFPLLSTCSGAPAPAPPGSTTCLPGGITAGPDGAIWITEEYGNRIVRMTTSGAVTHQIGIPTSNSLPSEITVGPDGLVWFTESSGNKIGRVNANFTISEFNLSGNPDGIVAHAGSLWVTQFGSDQISRIDPANPTSPANTYSVGNEPGDITVGPDGRLWFTESAGNAIGVLSTSGGFIDYPVTPGADPSSITATGGALWFTEGVGNRIGRISTTGVITNEFFAGSGTPSGIATGSDGALYYTETDPNKIGRMTTTGTITNEFAIPTPGSQPGAIAPGPDGALWFAEHVGNKIGRVAVQLAPPVTTITGGPAGPTNDRTPSFLFAATEHAENVTGFECMVEPIDDGVFGCSSPFQETTELPDGPYVFRVRALSDTGPGPWATRSFTVDTNAPETTIDAGPSGPTNDTTPTFMFSSNEQASFECAIDQGDFAACASPYTTPALANGSHVLFVRATDAAGNIDETPASRSFTVDTTAPETTIGTGPSGPTNDTTPSFMLSSSEAGATVECKVDAGAFASCTSPFTTQSLADGPHTIEVRATDAAGNVDETPASRSFTVDTTAPETTIDTGPAGSTSDPTVNITFSSDEIGASFECKVDADAFFPCTSPYVTATLADGTHTFAVRATDAAGNTDQTPAIRSFTVDTTAPDTTITSGPVGTTIDSTPTFFFSASEVGSTFDCRLDGGSFGPCSSPFTAPPLGDGPHTFEVRATDPSRNADPTPASLSFAVAGGGSSAGDPGGGSGGTGAAGAPTSSPAPAPTVQGAVAAGAVRVSRTGSFTLNKHSIECPAGGPSCAVKISVTGSVNASAEKRKAKLGGASYTLAAGKKGAVKLKLTKKGQRLLRRSKRVKATVTITVTKGSKVTTRKVKVTLKAPGKA